MRAALIALLGAGLVLGLGVVRGAPEDDLKAFRDFYTERFPDTPFEDFANGLYSIDENRREEWEQMEEFPPYEFDIDEGEELFHEPFANGKGYADCFPDYESGVRQNYPHWDPERGEVVTMELAINLCREQHGEKPLKYYRGPIAQISAYLAYLSRGNVIDVKVPADDPRALAAYEEGKRHYYSRRGQLNFSCASCHVDAVGRLLRAELIGPALGQVSHFPVFPQDVAGDHHPASQLRGVQPAVAGRVVRAAEPRVPQPGVLPHLHEQRDPAERPGEPSLMAREAEAPARGHHRRRMAVSVAAAVLAAGAWGFAPRAPASDEAAFVAAYNAAAKARKAVRKAGFEWRDLRTMLRESKKLGKKGEYEKAIELANRARRQAELGLIQAEEQKSAWKEAVLK